MHVCLVSETGRSVRHVLRTRHWRQRLVAFVLFFSVSQPSNLKKFVPIVQVMDRLSVGVMASKQVPISLKSVRSLDHHAMGMIEE